MRLPTLCARYNRVMGLTLTALLARKPGLVCFGVESSNCKFGSHCAGCIPFIHQFYCARAFNFQNLFSKISKPAPIFSKVQPKKSTYKWKGKENFAIQLYFLPHLLYLSIYLCLTSCSVRLYPKTNPFWDQFRLEIQEKHIRLLSIFLFLRSLFLQSELIPKNFFPILHQICLNPIPQNLLISRGKGEASRRRKK